jgi:hypothetical protein
MKVSKAKMKMRYDISIELTESQLLNNAKRRGGGFDCLILLAYLLPYRYCVRSNNRCGQYLISYSVTFISHRNASILKPLRRYYD